MSKIKSFLVDTLLSTGYILLFATFWWVIAPAIATDEYKWDEADDQVISMEFRGKMLKSVYLLSGFGLFLLGVAIWCLAEGSVLFCCITGLICVAVGLCVTGLTLAMGVEDTTELGQHLLESLVEGAIFFLWPILSFYGFGYARIMRRFSNAYRALEEVYLAIIIFFVVGVGWLPYAISSTNEMALAVVVFVITWAMGMVFMRKAVLMEDAVRSNTRPATV